MIPLDQDRYQISKKMAEIDDIFASIKILKAATPTPIPPEQKKKEYKKRKRVAESTISSQSDSRPAPEIVIDSSATVTHTTHAKRPRVSKTAKNAAKKNQISVRKKTDHEMEGKFQDSRGSESRQSSISLVRPYYPHHFSGRKTEEGWSIYKEDELGIRDKGGGK